MLPGYKELKALSDLKNIQMRNDKFNETIKKFTFLQILNDDEIEFNILQKIYDSKVIIIKTYFHENKEYIIACFEGYLIIFDRSCRTIIRTIFSSNREDKIFFIPNDQKYKLYEEIQNLIKSLEINSQNNESIKNFWQIIKPVIAAYLIHKNYVKTYKDRLNNFTKKIQNPKQPKKFDDNDFVFLRLINSTGSASINLKYHIQREKIYVIKTFFREIDKLNSREINNYKIMNFIFIPKYYGQIRGQNSFVIEFINGQTIQNLKEKNLSLKTKIEIIIEILFTFEYLHRNNFVYRDLKPNNIMIDQNNHVVLIDFDRMININENTTFFTCDFESNFVAPEIIQGKNPTFKSDVYSIGLLIYCILMNDLKCSKNFITDFKNKFPLIYEIYESCEKINQDERPTIGKLNSKFINKIDDLIPFYLREKIEKNVLLYMDILTFSSAIHCLQQNSSCSAVDLYCLGKIYYKGKYLPFDINKAIYYLTLASKQNYSSALNDLGYIYFEGKHVRRDINKTIEYLTLASELNDSEAQKNLALIYSLEKLKIFDINKAIHYFTLSANQDNSTSQYRLGMIYYEGKYIPRDINKAIEYLTLSSNQNYSKAQYNLGMIYYEGKYIKNDINKAIHYLTLASNQDFSKAQFTLGNIYYEGKYVKNDINKAIHYFLLASKDDHPTAQNNLGLIYYEGKYVERDINKAIQYFELASNQNLSSSQYNLGFIYYEGKFVERNINKSIHYFELASNNNYAPARFNLGLIYLTGIYTEFNIQKAINYLTLASNQNYSIAQFVLGTLYYDGNYIKHDINKSLFYLSQASKQNNSDALNNLGSIYYEGKYVSQNIEKSLYYYSLSSNLNNPHAQNNLGLIYYEGKYIPKNINKSIHYFKLASDLNFPASQCNLGFIYYEGKFIPKDLNKAIYYFELASNNNYATAQYILGIIYYEGKFISRDINKSIHYLNLSSNQNFPPALNLLGFIYYEGKYISRDIKKAIHYLSHISNFNFPSAQFNLGIIYFEGKYIQKDINKAIQYFKLCSNQNHSHAQFNLGMIYYEGKDIERNIEKALYYFNLSAKNNFQSAQLILADLYFEGKFVERNLSISIKLYKEVSSFYNQFAKNNLGVIYKCGFNNIVKNLLNAKIYFNEAIHEKNDAVSMYNLSNILLDENDDISEPIKLLIESSNKFNPSSILLYLLFAKKISVIDNQKLKNELDKFKKVSDENVSKIFSDVQKFLNGNSFDHDLIEKAFKYFRETEYVYINYQPISIDEIDNQPKEYVLNTRKDINEDFYEGFN